jgi:hypothetical protein
MGENKYDYSKQPYEWLIEIVAGDKPGTPRRIAAEHELEKRQASDANDKWDNKPRGKIIIAVSSTIIAALILGLLKHFYPHLF